MGIVRPHPAMRKKEARQIKASLVRFDELMKRFQAQGMHRKDASVKAYRIVTGREKYLDK